MSHQITSSQLTPWMNDLALCPPSLWEHACICLATHMHQAEPRAAAPPCCRWAKEATMASMFSKVFRQLGHGLAVLVEALLLALALPFCEPGSAPPAAAVSLKMSEQTRHSSTNTCGSPWIGSITGGIGAALISASSFSSWCFSCVSELFCSNREMTFSASELTLSVSLTIFSVNEVFCAVNEVFWLASD